MKFDIYELRHIVSNIGDLLFTSRESQPINISVDQENDSQDKVFMKLAFPLSNGISEIRIYSNQSFFLYLDNNGEILKKIEFNNSHVREGHGSFRIALKQIISFDRQNSNKTIDKNTLIDRSSFGLTNIN